MNWMLNQMKLGVSGPAQTLVFGGGGVNICVKALGELPPLLSIGMCAVALGCRRQMLLLRPICVPDDINPDRNSIPSLNMLNVCTYVNKSKHSPTGSTLNVYIRRFRAGLSNSCLFVRLLLLLVQWRVSASKFHSYCTVCGCFM